MENPPISQLSTKTTRPSSSSASWASPEDVERLGLNTVPGRDVERAPEISRDPQKVEKFQSNPDVSRVLCHFSDSTWDANTRYPQKQRDHEIASPPVMNVSEVTLRLIWLGSHFQNPVKWESPLNYQGFNPTWSVMQANYANHPLDYSIPNFIIPNF